MKKFDIKWIATILFIFGGTSVAIDAPWIKYSGNKRNPKVFTYCEAMSCWLSVAGQAKEFFYSFYPIPFER